MIAGYAQQLAASGGRLYLSGVEPEMVAQFHHAQVKDNTGTIKVFQATEVLGEPTIEAVADAPYLIGGSSLRSHVTRPERAVRERRLGAVTPHTS